MLLLKPSVKCIVSVTSKTPHSYELREAARAPLGARDGPNAARYRDTEPGISENPSTIASVIGQRLEGQKCKLCCVGFAQGRLVKPDSSQKGLHDVQTRLLICGAISLASIPCPYPYSEAVASWRTWVSQSITQRSKQTAKQGRDRDTGRLNSLAVSLSE